MEPLVSFRILFASGMLRHVLKPNLIKSENNYSLAAICLKALKLGKLLQKCFSLILILNINLRLQIFTVKWGIKNEIEIYRFGCHTFTSYVFIIN